MKYIYTLIFIISLSTQFESTKRSEDLFVYMFPWVLEAFNN